MNSNIQRIPHLGLYVFIQWSVLFYLFSLVLIFCFLTKKIVTLTLKAIFDGYKIHAWNVCVCVCARACVLLSYCFPINIWRLTLHCFLYNSISDENTRVICLFLSIKIVLFSSSLTVLEKSGDVLFPVFIQLGIFSKFLTGSVLYVLHFWGGIITIMLSSFICCPIYQKTIHT